MSGRRVQRIGANDLARLKVQHPDLSIIDVRLSEDHAAERIPGSSNNCVFEVSFLERMEAGHPDKSMPVCVYGAHGESLESRMAALKLIRSGYVNVSDFCGGLAAWKQAGKGVEGGGERDIPRADAIPLPDGKWRLDLERSRLGWTGRNLLNKHSGTVAVKSGELEILDGLILSGDVVLDMKAIRCDDLAGDKLHDVLVHHLESDDFFDVENFPEARFEILGSERLEEATPGAANLVVEGELELKGLSGEVEVSATAGVTETGLPAAQASFSIDRTRWNVLYGSGRFFQRLAGHLVNDEIGIEVKIVGMEKE